LNPDADALTKASRLPQSDTSPKIFSPPNVPITSATPATAEKSSRSGYYVPDISVPLHGIDRRVEVN
jgi:hypothetical protein